MAKLIDADKLVPKHFLQRTDKIIGYGGTQPIYEYVDVIAYDVDGAPTVEAIPISFIKDCIITADDWTFDKDTLWHLIERWENNVAKI